MSVDDSTYRHTQFGRVQFLAVIVAALVAAVLGLTVTEARAIAGATFVILVGTMINFVTMTVEVRREEVAVWFGPGLIRKRIRLTEVVGVRPVRNPWYYGWGIRKIRRGWMFNVAGFDAVELEFATGRLFRIGTDEPDRLMDAIRQVQAGQSPGRAGTSTGM